MNEGNENADDHFSRHAPLSAVRSGITEWKNIGGKPAKKLLYTITFPVFIFTYVPIAIVALFRKVEWKLIAHTVAKSIEDFH